jgi:hypothetical protein
LENEWEAHNKSGQNDTKCNVSGRAAVHLRLTGKEDDCAHERQHDGQNEQ